MHRSLERLRGQEGLTLVELSVATALLGIVMLVFTNMLASVQTAVVNEDVRSRLNDDARLALQTIDRQVRSGNLLYNPTSESDPGYLLRVYTQTNYPTDGPHCALWKIDDQSLLYRSWPANDPDGASDWRVVTDGVVNQEEAEEAFTLNSTGRTVTATFYLNADYEHHPEATQHVSLAITGRNTSYGYPNDVCEELPD